MAENESLDLGGAYGKRWNVPFELIRKGGSGKDVAKKVATALHARRNGCLWAKWLDPPQQIERHEQGVTYASAC